MSSTSPTVSVCIPTYKGAATIGAAIESVLGQTLADFELIVIDDGSPDETRAIVDRYADRRLVYRRNDRNLGPQGNWNRCLELARGKYFKLLPHDDLLHPACLEQQVAVLDSDDAGNIALAFCARNVIGPDGRLLTSRGYPGGKEGRIDAQRLMCACVRRGTNLLGEPGAVLFRRSLAEKIGSFDATNPYVIDLDYWVRLLAHGDAYFCPSALASFRLSRQSWSVAIGSEQSSDFRHFVARHTAQGSLPATALDRFFGRFTPALNSAARQVFYWLYLR